MIDRFGKVMVYVNNPSEVANFFSNKLGYKIGDKTIMDGEIIGVQVALDESFGAVIEFFSKKIVERFSPEITISMPSLCMYTYNIKKTRDEMIENDVNVGELVEMNGVLSCNFEDNENNYYAMIEVKQK